MADSDRQWRQWGERDPYFAVLTQDQYRADNIDQHRDEFFASGESNVTNALKRLETAFGKIDRSRALDFGCGVGRLTIPLARRFQSVVGLDISAAMLDEAKRNSNLPIDYALSDDTLSNAPGRFDFVLSRIVLQHIPVQRGMKILGQLLDRADACSIHLSVRRETPRFLYWVKHSVPGAAAILNLARGKSMDTPVMQMNEYPLPEVFRLFSDKGFPELLVTHEQHGSVDTVEIISRRA